MCEGQAAPLGRVVREGAAAGLMALGKRRKAGPMGQIPSLGRGAAGGQGGLTHYSGKVGVERWLWLAMRARNMVGLSKDTWQQGFLERCEEGQAGAWPGRDGRVP